MDAKEAELQERVQEELGYVQDGVRFSFFFSIPSIMKALIGQAANPSRFPDTLLGLIGMAVPYDSK